MLPRHVVFQAVETDVSVAREDDALHAAIGTVFLLDDHIFKTAGEIAASSVVLARHRKLQTLIKEINTF